MFIATKSISKALITTVDLNVIHSPDSQTTAPNAAIESTLDSKTLGTLSQSPNPEIARSATEILLTRFATSDKEITAWSADIFSPSPSIRKRATALFTLLRSRGLAPGVPEPDVLKHKGLVYRSRDLDTAGARTLRSAYRAAAVRKENGILDAWNALRRVSTVLERAMECVPIVVLESMNERQVVHWARAQRRLLDLGDREAKEDLMFLEAVKAMNKAGKVEEGQGENGTEDETEEFDDVDLDGGERDEVEVADLDLRAVLQRFERDLEAGNISLGDRIARLHEESPEEAEVRRRRREAVVVHVGGGAVGREDIFQPQHTS